MFIYTSFLLWPESLLASSLVFGSLVGWDITPYHHSTDHARISVPNFTFVYGGLNKLQVGVFVQRSGSFPGFHKSVSA
jgi:hypothetical protein